MKRLNQKKTVTQRDDEDIVTIWFRLPYLGNKGEELVKLCKLKCCFKTKVKFVTLYNIKKCAMFQHLQHCGKFLETISLY